MFTLIFIVIFVVAGLRVANHYPTRLQLGYDENAISKKQYYRLFTAIFDNNNWIGVLFAALNLFFLLASVEQGFGVLITSLVVFVLAVLPYWFNYRFKTSADYFWGSLPLIFGLFLFQTAINPFAEIRLMFILPLNFFIFSILSIGLLIYNEIKQKLPIASFGFAISGTAGLILALIVAPTIFLENIFVALGLFIGMIALFILNRRWLGKKTPTAKVIKMNMDHYYNVQKNSEQDRLNHLLDKIKTQGMNALSKEEKQFLEDYSKK